MSGDAMHSEEMTLFRDMARRTFETEMSPHYQQWEEDHMVPRELWNTLGVAGLLCPDMPEEYGGAGEISRYRYSRPGYNPGTGRRNQGCEGAADHCRWPHGVPALANAC